MKLVSIPANPVPDNVVTGNLASPDGRKLRFARWAPPLGRKGTVCILPGRAEFIEKYFETVRDLRARGFAVAVLDWRGQGLSDRVLSDTRKGHIEDFSEYDNDLATFMQQVVLPDCPPPVFAIGHSMGASVLIRAAFQGHRWFDRVVLSTPMIALPGMRGSGGARATVQLMRALRLKTSYVPGGDSSILALRPFPGNVLTSDPVRYARNASVLEVEPALAIGSPTVGWLDAAFRVMRSFAEPGFPAKIRQPILIVAVGRDEVVSTPAVENFASRLRAGSHLIVAGSRHEVLMEQDRFRAQFWAAFDAFVPGTPLFG
jgi:lysophospholipase